MKYIKITKPIMIAGKRKNAGETVEVDNGLAENLRLRGRATIISAPAEKSAKPPKDKP